MTIYTNTPNTADVILDQLQVVKLNIKLWTSSKKLRPEDLQLANGSKLPPEELASLGTKKTVDPTQLKEFTRIKKEAERICLEAGTRFIGGFANPTDEIPRIVKALDDLSGQFNDERERFLSVYATITDEWVRRHPAFADAIRRAIEPVGSVKQKLVFDYMIFRVTKPEGGLGDSLDRHTLSLSDQLFREIAQDAKDLVDRSFVGKDTVTARTLGAFRRMRDKLDSLGFLDHRCMPVVDEIDKVLASTPKNGPYNGAVYHSLFSLGLLLSDPEKIKQHGSGLSLPQPTVADDSGYSDVNLDLPLNALSTSTVEIFQDAQPSVAVLPVSLPDNGMDPDAIEDDDLPGFDEFLANYKPAPKVLAEKLDDEISDDACLLPETTEFMDEVRQIVSDAATQALASVPVDSIEDELTADPEQMTESETKTTVSDFWF